jgi:Zn-finger in Ran binding protein and others
MAADLPPVGAIKSNAVASSLMETQTQAHTQKKRTNNSLQLCFSSFRSVMPRSEEAIRRRADKRQRTEEEQRMYDRKDMLLLDKKKANKAKEKTIMKRSNDQQQQDPLKLVAPNTPMDPSLNNSNETHELDPLREPGAWKCPGCGNENFASRNWCNSKTCDQRRPDHIPAPSGRAYKKPKVDFSKNHYQPNPFDEEGAWNCPKCQFQNFASRERCKGFQCQERRPTTAEGSDPTTKIGGSAASSRQSRHDPETSKVLVWSKQADSITLNKNQELRKKFQESNGGEGMLAEDIERAKILIARDERKRQKKLVQEESTPQQVEIEGEAVAPKSTGEESTPPEMLVDPTIQRKRNKKLRKQYVATGGKGMSEEDIERAKVLIARDERKRQKLISVSASA